MFEQVNYDDLKMGSTFYWKGVQCEVISLYIGRKSEKKSVRFKTDGGKNGDRIWDDIKDNVTMHPTKRRYWIWNMVDSAGRAHESAHYIGDNGAYTSGEIFPDFDKFKIEKIKNRFIEL